MLENLNQAAKSSKVLQRDPDTFEGFVKDAADAHGVPPAFMIDANVFMQSGIADQVIAASPSVAAQINDAVNTGGQISIPTEELLTRIAPIEGSETLIDNLIDPNVGMSRAEAKAWKEGGGQAELEAQIGKALQDKADDDVFQASRGVVEQNLLDMQREAVRLANEANPGSVNIRDEQLQVAARINSLWFATRAAVMGITPEQVYAMYPVTYSDVGGGQLNQSLAAQPPAGWVHSTSGADAAALWDAPSSDTSAVFWTDLQGKIAVDAPAIAGYSHSVNKNAITHIRNRHGDSKTEAAHGQVAITGDDMARIPEIVTHYDDAKWERETIGTKSKVIGFAKTVDDGVLVYMARVSDKRQNIAAVSMWKYRDGVSVQDALSRAFQEQSPRKAGIESKPRPLSVYETDSVERTGDSVAQDGAQFNQQPFDGSEQATTQLPEGTTHIDVDGTQRPALNSNGQPIHWSEEGVRNFWRWFGDSKVVDGDGRPLVVYHGTVADFNTFSIDASSKGLLFTTQDNFFAEGLMSGRSESGIHYPDGTNTMPVYVRALNPFDYENRKHVNKLAEAASLGSLAIREISKGSWERIEDRTTLYYIKSLGFDGVYVEESERKNLAAFSPEQIKSATGNTGAFDPNKTNILHQTGWHGSPHRGIENEGFKLNKIGTGEGNAAWGEGIYFGGKRETAEYYREALSAQWRESNDIKWNGKTALEHYNTAENRGEYGKMLVLEQIMLHKTKRLIEDQLKEGVAEGSQQSKDGLEYLETLPKEAFTETHGQLYSADIPEDHELLDYDKPLSEQPDMVQKIVSNAVEQGHDVVIGVLGKLGAVTRNEDTGSIEVAKDGDRTGGDFYSALSNELGSPKAASEYLNSIGIPGLRYFDGSSRAVGEGTHNYVIWDESRLNKDIQTYYQGARGSFSPERLLISLLNGADFSTVNHEFGHFALTADIDIAGRILAKGEITSGEQQLLDDVSGVLRKLGNLQGDIGEQLNQWYSMSFEEQEAIQENFTENLENYLINGEAPSLELAPYFQKIRAWMLNVYKSITEFLRRNPRAGRLDPELKAIFGRMLATNEQIQMAEQGRSMIALFTAPFEEGGMTAESFANYHADGINATNTAIQELQAKALRDLQYARNSRTKEIARLQKKAKGLRYELQMESRREVMSQPVYRAWNFLTGRIGAQDRIAAPQTRQSSPNAPLDETVDSLFTAIAKLGGINRAAAQSEWGIDPKDRPKTESGRLVLKDKGGLSIDGMAEALFERGYLSPDDTGSWDITELEEKFGEEARGNTQYSLAYDYAPEQLAGGQLANPQALGAGRLDIGALREMYGAGEPHFPQRRATTLDEAKTEAEAFTGKPLTNSRFNLTAVVSKATVGKMTSESAVKKSTSPEDHALAVANLDQLFENASIDEPHADKRGEPTIAQIHRVYAPMVSSSGEVLVVKMTVKETTSEKNPNPLYSVETIDVEKPVREAPSQEGIERDTGSSAVAEIPTDGLSDNVLRMIADVKARVGAGSFLPEMMSSRGMTADTGLHPDIVGDLYGFSSGDELVRALSSAIPPNEAIDALTDRKMLDRYGELSSQEAIERAADMAIHNDVRARFTTTEANALAQAVGNRKILVSAAKEYAARGVLMGQAQH
ncbi:MAG: hypothetical protein LBV44_08595 [Methylobacillus sp.]|nr:hypothetical protein [Methylobacillus sp.]